MEQTSARPPMPTPERFFEAVGRTVMGLRECELQDYMGQLRYWHQGQRRLVIEWQGGAYAYEAAQLLQQLGHDSLAPTTLTPDTFRLLQMDPGAEHDPDTTGYTRTWAVVEVCGVEVQLRAESPVGQDAAVLAEAARLSTGLPRLVAK